MVSLVSPDVSVVVSDQSFYVPGAAATVPLIIIATQDHKMLTDGSPAIGTFESGVVRTVTGIQQSQLLYGTPSFLTDANGNPQHGDARNEYGLDCLNKTLEIADVAYVLRANVNLNDTYTAILNLWTDSVSDAGDALNALITSYIAEFNLRNGLVPADSTYKVTVNKTELLSLVGDALADTLELYSFSSSNFNNDFLQDHTVDHAGFQDAIYSSTAGFIQTTDATGLANDSTVYGLVLNLISINGNSTFQVEVTGSHCQTFGALISQLQSAIQIQSSSNSTVSLIQGRIRITSDLLGATSTVNITSDGFVGVSPLFASTLLFSNLDTPVQGQGISSLNIYDTTFSVITGSYDGLYAMINNWSAGQVVSSEFTAQEAEGLLIAAGTDFSQTKEFKNDTSLGANDAARRVSIVKQLKAIINDPSTGIRADNLAFNVVICPGFPEVTSDLLNLSIELLEEVFVIGETPFDKSPTGPGSIAEWASSTSKVVSYDVAYYYPHGLTTNLDGSTIMSSAASLAMRTIAFSDQQTDVWFAPAGVTRGTISDVSQIGYVTGTLGTATTFTVDYIDKGTRDILYATGTQVNPISFIPGRGILIMGAKTTYGATSALDRVPVSRLIKYIKRQLRKGLFVFLFEPNDQTTWNNIQAACNSFLGTLIGRRALFDFATIIDPLNNTPTTIDQHAVYIECALKPIPDLEFIYVTLAVVNTGANIGGRAAA